MSKIVPNGVNEAGQIDGFELDGWEYDILISACQYVAKKKVPGMSAEIGTRKGGGSALMLDTLYEAGPVDKIHVSIDPYGDVYYNNSDAPNVLVKFNYNNQMRDNTMINLRKYASDKEFNFVFINMEDYEFFKRYSDGIPIYDIEKRIMNQYSVVFLDGPHSVAAVNAEIEFFCPRQAKHGMLVFDNIDYYDHDIIDKKLLETGYRVRMASHNKKSYEKVVA